MICFIKSDECPVAILGVDTQAPTVTVVARRHVVQAITIEIVDQHLGTALVLLVADKRHTVELPFGLLVPVLRLLPPTIALDDVNQTIAVDVAGAIAVLVAKVGLLVEM